MMPSQLPLVARPPISTNPARSYGYELLCRAARMSINVPSRIRASSDDRSSVRALLSKSSRAASSKAGSSRIDLQSAATSSRSCKGSRVCDLRPCTPRLRLKSFNHRSVMQSTGGTLPGQSRIDVLKELQHCHHLSFGQQVDLQVQVASFVGLSGELVVIFPVHWPTQHGH
jgi:hypothetical protein